MQMSIEPIQAMLEVSSANFALSLGEKQFHPDRHIDR
jgi:hypothetical protein